MYSDEIHNHMGTDFGRTYDLGPYQYQSTHMKMKLEVSLRAQHEIGAHKTCEIEIRFVTFEMPTSNTIDEVMFDARERVKEMLGLSDG